MINSNDRAAHRRQHEQKPDTAGAVSNWSKGLLKPLFYRGGASRKMREALVALGPDYTTLVIDWELCIYRRVSSGFEFEVSGMNNNRRRNYFRKGKLWTWYCRDIWVWDMRPGFPHQIVVHIEDIKDLRELTCVLEKLSAKFTDPDYIKTLTLERMQNLFTQGERLSAD